MIRKLALALVLPMLATTVSLASSPSASGRHGVLPIAQQGQRYGHTFDLPKPPANFTPEQRANWIMNERPALGRTPASWLDWARSISLDAPASARGIHADLATATIALEMAVGLAPTAADRVSIQHAAAAVPAAVQGPFADLVATVATAYAAQVPLAKMILGRLSNYDGTNTLVTQGERDVMTARQSAIVRALGIFRAQTQAAFDSWAKEVPHGVRAGGTDAPLFSDPAGAVYLGGVGDGTYNRKSGLGTVTDPILLVDPAGNDLYNTSAGGACPVSPNTFGNWMTCNGLILSVNADLGDGTTAPSNDVYNYDGPESAIQGAGGPGGIGILVDVGGSDRYTATMKRSVPEFGLNYYFDGGAQGYGYGGDGLLLDAVGDDVYTFNIQSTASQGYSIWGFAQGFGAAGGIGVASDGSGTDQWLSNGLGQAGNRGFEGLYTVGVGMYGGVGIATDTGLGDDRYSAIDKGQTVDFYAIGFAAFGGVGIVGDDGGNDSYYTLEQAVGPNASWINPLLNCALGGASFGGVGLMVDGGGNDTYYGATVPYGSGRSWVMDNGFGGPSVAYGLFADLGGNDTYTMSAGGANPIISGRGRWDPNQGGLDLSPLGANTWGTFVDLGGTDSYDHGIGANNSVWTFGVDRG